MDVLKRFFSRTGFFFFGLCRTISYWHSIYHFITALHTHSRPPLLSWRLCVCAVCVVPGPGGSEADHVGSTMKVMGRTPCRSCKCLFGLRFFFPLFRHAWFSMAPLSSAAPFASDFAAITVPHLHGWVAEQKMGISITGGLGREMGVWGTLDCMVPDFSQICNMAPVGGKLNQIRFCFPNKCLLTVASRKQGSALAMST